MHYELIQFSNDLALAQSAARQWLELVQSHQPGAPPLFFALSGGRIARQFFNAAAAHAQTNRVSLDQTHFFWADERCVPPSDAESNFAVAQELLFTPLQVAPAQIHRIPGELDPAQAAAIAQEEICRLVPLSPSNQPILDLIFLGMGEDGHIASLFPAEPPDVLSDSSVYRAVKASKPPPDRVTINYPAIASARNVWILASGPGKEKALETALSGRDKSPVANVLRMRKRTLIFTDVPLK